MLNDETLKALIEAIVYVSPEPVSLETITKSVEEEDRERVRAKLLELMGEYQRAEHGIHIRQVAGGYQFSSKPEHHDILRKFVKSLKPPVRLSKPALEALAVIAYRQPITLPEINEIRGVDCGGVIHTLMERKLIVTSGRKNVVGRPILYRTSREFLVHFGLKDIDELPSLKEFEELARQALGPELDVTTAEALATEGPSERGAASESPADQTGAPSPERTEEASAPAIPDSSLAEDNSTPLSTDESNS
jgi:segregation and condensation protein B